MGAESYTNRLYAVRIMKNALGWTILLVVLVAIAFLAYYRQQPARQESRPAGAAPSSAVRNTPGHPPIRYPLPGNEGQATQRNATKAPPLPPLDKSDPTVQKAFAGLFGAGRFTSLFNADNIIQRAVVTIDNVMNRQLPPRYLAVKPAAGRFQVTERGGNQFISPRNYRRYTPYVRLAEHLDSDKLIALYVHLYPLFQQAYKDLGYRGYFNDRLIEVINNLLDTPDVRGPVKLIQPGVFYKFADPHLEALTAGQKILVRVGPGNAAHIKAKLRAIRQGLIQLGRTKRP